MSVIQNSKFIIQNSKFTFLVVFLAALTLYLLTLAPGVVGGDAGEHQFAVPLLGIPHTTGYPLYVLAGKLWTLLIPWGEPAWRLNLFSAVAGAAAAGVAAVTVHHLKPGRGGAIVGGIILSGGLTLWQWSTIAGVRSLNVLFFALLTLLAVTWHRQRQVNPEAAARTLRWLALTVGLSLAHHRTTVFFLPSLAGWIGWHDRSLWRQPRRLLILAALALAPLSLYAFIYFRGVNNPPYTHEPIHDLQSFWFLVGSGDSTGLFFSIDPAYLPARLSFIWADILRQLSWPGVLLAVLGALFLATRRTGHFLFQSLLVVLLLAFTLDFEVVNLNEAPTWYLMPAYLMFALWAGVGVNVLTSPLRRPPLTAGLAAGLLLLLGYTLLWPNWQKIYRDSTAPLDEWRQILRGTQAQRYVEAGLPYVAPNSIIWADWEQYTPMRYYQFIHGLRRDVTVRNPLNEWPKKVAAAHAAGQEVYLGRKTADLIGTPFLTMVGPLVHVQTGPNFTPPADIVPVHASLENELELVGYRLSILPQNTPGGKQAGDIIQLTLYWRALHRLSWDYALSLRLVDTQGQEIYRRDASHPVLSSYPTSLWTPGEVVADFYELPYPPQVDALSLHLLVYRTEGPGQWHNLLLDGTNPPQEGVRLGPWGAEQQGSR